MRMSRSKVWGKERRNGFTRGDGARCPRRQARMALPEDGKKEGQKLVVPFSSFKAQSISIRKGRVWTRPGGPARPRKGVQSNMSTKNHWKSLAAQKGGKILRNSSSQRDTQHTSRHQARCFEHKGELGNRNQKTQEPSQKGVRVCILEPILDQCTSQSPSLLLLLFGPL